MQIMPSQIFDYRIEEITGGNGSVTAEKRWVVITGTRAGWTDLKIPEYIEEAPVREIAPHAFEKNPVLRSIELPETLRKIGSFALARCPRLQKIYMHDGIRDYHGNVLRQDPALRQIHLTVHQMDFTVMRDILSDTDVRLQFCLHLPDGEARLLFPGYDYAFAENTMARTIQFSISGTGLEYRECVWRKEINYREYDRLFARVIYDDFSAAARIAADRLLYPYDLIKTHAQVYENYLREHAQEILLHYVMELADEERGKEDVMAELRLMADRGMITGAAAEPALRLAADRRLTEAAGILMAGRETSIRNASEEAGLSDSDRSNTGGLCLSGDLLSLDDW